MSLLGSTQMSGTVRPPWRWMWAAKVPEPAPRSTSLLVGEMRRWANISLARAAWRDGAAHQGVKELRPREE